MVKMPDLQLTDVAHLMQGIWVQRAIRIINALLVIWIAWLLATLTWSLLEEPATEVTVADAPVPVKTAPDQDRQLAHQLPVWHLFGETVREAAPVVAVPVDAPDTRLKLVLRGAFASDDPDIARAIIADPRGDEEMYAVGDTLPGNAELREIQTDRIILLRSGRYETLRLPDERQAGAAAGLRSSDASVSTQSAVANTPAQRLRSIRQQLRQNPKSLYGLVRATPKKGEDGKLVGYTLRPGRDPALFKQMNLQDGDVVTRINDIALDTLANGMQALKSAEAGETVTMTVLRDGREETLSFEMPE